MRFRTKDEIQRHLRAQGASGMSIAAYCRQKGICEDTFYNWRKRFFGKAEVPPVAPFIKIPFTAPVTERFELTLPNGSKVLAPLSVEVAVLREVVRVLAPLRPRG